MELTRIRQLNNISTSTNGNCVIYLMSRDQRAKDNYALLAAQQYAIERKLPLLVMFNLFKAENRFLQQYTFMIDGLKEVERDLLKHEIPVYLVSGPMADNVVKASSLYKAAALFMDFSPLREATQTRMSIADKSTIPVFEVDATNVVPLWVASDKEEYAAATIRPKIHKLWDTYIVEPPRLKKHPVAFGRLFKNDWDGLLERFKLETLPDYNPPFTPGEEAAVKALHTFISRRLNSYADKRNDPANDYLSDLSPYLHFGQLFSLRAVLEVRKAVAADTSLKKDADAFIEELVVRRELAQNYCYYNKHYTSLEGARTWARETLLQHRNDKRPQLYTLEQLEQAETYDRAWNAAQVQMLRTGKMHGYMRMYWAKKVLEWTDHPQKAIDYLVYLNDKYHLDGYDANGYTGIMWSIAGVHDRPWFERPIFGKIRYMNYGGLQRKFNIDAYIERWLGTLKNTEAEQESLL